MQLVVARAPRERPQIPHDVPHALRPLPRHVDHVDHLLQLLADRGPLAPELVEPRREGRQAAARHHVQVRHHVGQGVVDLVGHARGERPDRDHAVGQQARLHLLSLGEVAAESDDVRPAIVLEDHRHDLRVDDEPVLAQHAVLLRRQGPPRLGEARAAALEDVAVLGVDEGVDARAEHLLRHVVAEERRERGVGVDEATVVGGVDRDGVGRVLDERAEPRLADLEGVLGLVALGDVVDDRRHADDPPRVVHERRVVPVAEDEASVLGDVVVDAALAPAPGHERPEDVDHRLARRAGDEQLDAQPAEGLRLAPAEDARRRRVPLDDAPRRVEPHDAQGVTPHVQREPLLRGLQRALAARARSLTSSAVPIAADDRPVGVAERGDAERDGDLDAAGGRDVAPLVDPGLPAQRQLERRQEAPVAQGAHVEAAQRLRARAEDLHEARVEVGDDEVAPVEEHADGGLLEERAIPLLRLAQSLRDVVRHLRVPRPSR